MSSIKLESNASGTGIFTLASPNSNTNRTLTLPDATGTVVVTGGAQTIEFAAGSASTPSITTTGDTNTGIFFPAADTIGFAEGGAEVMRIDSDGDVGIGNTSPSRRLYVQFDNATTWSTTDFDKTSNQLYLRNADTTTNAFTGIQFGVGANGEAAIAALRTGDGESAIAFGTRGGGSRAERARITSGGDFVLGATTNSGYNFRVSAGNKYAAGFENSSGNIPITCQIVSGSGSQTFITFYNGTTNTGYINTTGTNTLYTSISDYRLKENIQPMTNALTAVAQLRPCTYTWKSDGSDGQGFIAHELQSVVPDCVTGEKDAVDADGNPKYQGIDTSFLVATLTAAIQELKAELDTTKARLAALEAQ